MPMADIAAGTKGDNRRKQKETRMEQEVKFKCPICGKEWTEMQDDDDEWFEVAPLITLCTKCRDKEVKRIIDPRMVEKEF